MAANMKGGTSGAQTTSGQPDNSELSRFMNNGGGPEPHQGSNPGAQSDPGPKEVGFYDKATEHMGGDDGVRAAVERPSPMRMGGYDGTAPNAGQRGGQNTGSSGAQTTGSGGSMGAETRNPVGFAAEPGGEGYQGVRQSRAAQMLVDMREDSPTTYAREGDVYDEKPRMADKAGEVADSVKDKASGFFSRAVDRMEDFLTVDLNNDGNIGGGSRTAAGSDNATRMEPQAFETHERAGRVEPQAFETREKAQASPSNVDGTGGDHANTGAAPGESAQKDDSFSVFYGGQGETDPIMFDSTTKPARNDMPTRSGAKQRELVDA